MAAGLAFHGGVCGWISLVFVVFLWSCLGRVSPPPQALQTGGGVTENTTLRPIPPLSPRNPEAGWVPRSTYFPLPATKHHRLSKPTCFSLGLAARVVQDLLTLGGVVLPNLPTTSQPHAGPHAADPEQDSTPEGPAAAKL